MQVDALRIETFPDLNVSRISDLSLEHQGIRNDKESYQVS